MVKHDMKTLISLLHLSLKKLFNQAVTPEYASCTSEKIANNILYKYAKTGGPRKAHLVVCEERREPTPSCSIYKVATIN